MSAEARDATSEPPRVGGSYLLILRVETPAACVIGRLGEVRLESGDYIYSGSALQSGGLRARLLRHARPLTRRHWHVDHLRTIATVMGAWYRADGQRHEHAWAHALAARCPVPVPRFGASDCRCPAHLFRAPDADGPDGAATVAAAAGSGPPPLTWWPAPA